MSWFSKMINYFTGETEEDKQLEKRSAESRQLPEQLPPVHNAPAQMKQPAANTKNADAKIAYQYPKGNFKFPVIPDQQNSRTEPRRPAAKPERKAPAAPKKPAGQALKKTDSKPVKKTFSPTEIPSPIYGYRSRDNQGPFNSRVSQDGGRETGTTLFQSYQQEAKAAESVISRLHQQNHEMLKKEADRLKARSGSIPDEATSQDKPDRPEVSALHKHQNHKPETFSFGYRKEEKKQDLHTSDQVSEQPPSFKKSAASLTMEEEEHETRSDVIRPSDRVEEQSSAFIETAPALSMEEEVPELHEPSQSVQPEEPDAHETAASLETTPALETERASEPEETAVIEVESEQEETVHPELVFEQEVIDEPEVKSESELEFVQEVKSEPEAGNRERPASLFQDVRNLNVHEENRSTQNPQQQAELELSEETKPEAGKVQEQASSGNRRSTVPFNVMMFGRDKQKAQRNQSAPGGSAYAFPSLQLLNIPPKEIVDDTEWLREQTQLLNMTLENFNVKAKVVHVTQGPAVTRLEVQPEPGVKVNKITNLTDDIKLSLSAKDIRIEAPIPGKNRIGIEVPNRHSKMVYLREILRSPDFINSQSPLTAALGLDISGQAVVTDLKKMPHGLIAGATGSGKSVCINTILVSLLYKASPHEVKLMLIDPKMVELAPYQNVPHLVSPVITDVKAATGALKWAVEEMERRYELFAHAGARDISRYNELAAKHNSGEHMPYLVIVIDELADLMMAAPADVEESICRIAQKARACGIHLIVATQRPSVDVITGLIKSNIPTRIAFSVSSQVDSRTILDSAGAEKLLGKGDMLFLENGTSKAVRLQGNFVSDEEIERVVGHVRNQMKPVFLFEQEELMRKSSIENDEDELLLEACEYIVDQGGASTSSLQRRFRIGYNRAARLMDMMEKQGIISEARGSKPREVLITEQDLESMQERSVY
ncbi:DNA translocase FtsK [Metabacillus indicus]|uniref:DNA translocase FtsK n=1 Tax=Metabacillus indicus TaxID=246786 RepID=UPI002A079466|nr:DNA translocase FtsK [Metabacillus indicus]MDX8291474.1 DNA translocase FtsK [Metabacillus indicus]